MNDTDLKKQVRDAYGAVARNEQSCCGSASCCGEGFSDAKTISSKIGYTSLDLQNLPEDSNLGLGCGNPTVHAGLTGGETVLDLGSGAGIDCFITANMVGPTGKVIGVDMTAEMIEKARLIAEREQITNVEFRLGEIEHLPVADNSVDLVISNCVINLVPDKQQVFSEVFRVLKPGGRLVVSDIVLNGPLPESILNSVAAYVGCVSGAINREDYLSAIRVTGFQPVEILEARTFPISLMSNDPTAQLVINNLNISKEEVAGLEHVVESIKVKAVKP